MKRIIFCALFIISMSSLSFGQDVYIGLKFSPTFSFSQVLYEGNTDGVDFASGGSSLRFIFGPIFDFNLKDDKYYFSTGLLYMPKRSSIEATLPGNLIDENNPVDPVSGELLYNLQYLQLPATLKLFTNEVFSGARIFFQIGSGIELKLSEKNKSDEDIFGNDPLDYNPIDIPVILAAGIEYDLGENFIAASLGYQRGLIKAVNDKRNREIDNDLLTKNQLFTINFAYFF